MTSCLRFIIEMSQSSQWQTDDENSYIWKNGSLAIVIKDHPYFLLYSVTVTSLLNKSVLIISTIF